MTRKVSDNDMSALARLSTLVNSSLDLMAVLDNAMKYVEELMDAETSSIFEVDHERDELRFRLARGKWGSKAQEIRLSMGEGIAGRVAQEGKPIVVPDIEQDERFASRIDAHTGFKTRSIICVPIKHKGRLIGVLEVLNKRGGPFDEDDVELLTVVSNQIGIAMENARLYERLRAKFTLTTEELKKTQQKVIQSERMVALARLSQGVAHEVRNPVMSIGGFAMRIKQKLPSDNPMHKYADIIIKETARLEKMVRDIEDYANMREPRFGEVNLKKLTKHALEDWKEKGGLANIEIQLDLPDDEATLPGDEGLLRVVLNNLFQNAAEAMANEGILSVVAYPEGKHVIIRVADTGRGIDPDKLPLIFDPFFTANTSGSGLGLTTVHRIVSEHGGEISVDSIPGEGTEFRIQLPLYPDDMQLSELEASQRRA
ncbi:MAG: GAF domain-containing protein [Deltaproteobacteria bacterium]|nr:GAF domain-containing protein [Deltaproteobacteria bacterium]